MPNWSYNWIKLEGKKEKVLEAARSFIGYNSKTVSLSVTLENILKEDGLEYDKIDHKSEAYRVYYDLAMKKALEEVQSNKEKDNELGITMAGIVPMPDEIKIDKQSVIDPYNPTYNHKDWFADNKQWWRWSIDNWGTKWDLCGTNLEELQEDIKDIEDNYTMECDVDINIYCETAWSPPEPFIKALSKKFPEIKVTASYEEEGGQFFYEGYFINGVETILHDSDSLALWYVYQGRDVYEILEERTAGFDSAEIEDMIEDTDVVSEIISSLLGAREVKDIIADIEKAFGNLLNGADAEETELYVKLRTVIIKELKQQSEEKSNVIG